MRLDSYLVIEKKIETKSKAQDLIKRGLVLVNNKPITKNGYQVKEKDIISVYNDLIYASRAGIKLAKALDYFNINVSNLEIIDVGSSTGGFTDCVLKRGAKKVYAYDVGKNQMIEKLRNDPRVELNEGTNILKAFNLKGDLILIDVSFTSIKPIIAYLTPLNLNVIALIKPQFEVGAKNLKKGIVKDDTARLKILEEIKEFGLNLGYKKADSIESGLKGKDGNLEYFIYFQK